MCVLSDTLGLTGTQPFQNPEITSSVATSLHTYGSACPEFDAVLDAELDKVMAPLRAFDHFYEHDCENYDSIGHGKHHVVDSYASTETDNCLPSGNKEVAYGRMHEDDDSGVFDFKRSLYGYAVNSIMWIISSNLSTIIYRIF